MSLYADTIATLRRSVARRCSFSSGPHAAKPCARFAQPRSPRAGPSAAAARMRSMYAARVSALRAEMRAVTSETTGCTAPTLRTQALARKRLQVQFTGLKLGPRGDHGGCGPAGGR